MNPVCKRCRSLTPAHEISLVSTTNNEISLQNFFFFYYCCYYVINHSVLVDVFSVSQGWSMDRNTLQICPQSFPGHMHTIHTLTHT